LGGVITGSHQKLKAIFDSEYLAIGSGITPFNAWMLLRGLRTLPMRLQRITASTNTVLQYLKSHPKIENLLFPFDESFPQYHLAKKQMNGACGLITFTIKDGTAQSITTFCESLQHFLIAVSWGGHESLILPKCAGIKPEEFDAGNIGHQYIRMYVGLEEPDYLIKDIEQALARI
jgi:cystathionine beta-lyase/cystathionine gamma-synthase